MSKSTVLEVAEEFYNVKQTYLKFIEHLKTIIADNNKYFETIVGDDLKFYFKFLNKIFVIKLSLRYDTEDDYYFGEINFEKVVQFTHENGVFRSLQEKPIEFYKEGETFSFPNKIIYYVSGKLAEPKKNYNITKNSDAETILFKWLHNYTRSAEFKSDLRF